MSTSSDGATINKGWMDEGLFPEIRINPNLRDYWLRIDAMAFMLVKFSMNMERYCRCFSPEYRAKHESQVE
jgi:hypothetical protein